MQKELVWFDCKRCGKSFMSYITGHRILSCGHDGGACFHDAILGEIHENSYLSPVLNVRECHTCRKGVDITQYV